MLRRRFLGLSFSWLACVLPALAQAPQTQTHRPKLVLAIVVDQMRYDYLTRFGPEFNAGLKRLLNEGAVFTNANYEAAPTVTAVGHSTILSGATPSVSGIVANTWFDRDEGSDVQSISDPHVETVGGNAPPASPRRLLVSTIGDELKLSGYGGSVYGVSLKDRSAILPAGRMADGAFWFDATVGAFVSSTYYFPQLPAWAASYNATHPADKFAGKSWMTTQLVSAPGPALWSALDATPFSDELVLDFATHVLRSEKLGQGPKTDLLSVSFSGVDYVGHATGPDTPRMRDMLLHVDQDVGKLLAAAEEAAGKGNVLVVFTADHGVAPVPEENIARKLPGSRYDPSTERNAVERTLRAKFGPGKYVIGADDMGLYLNRPRQGRSAATLEAAAAAVLRSLPHVYRVYTRTALVSGLAGGDEIDQRVRNGFHPKRSPDVLLIHEPYWIAGSGGTTHGSPFSYDTHVPLILWGASNLVKPGQYAGKAAMQDVAPTLANILGIAQPSGCLGRVLQEMLP